MKKLIIIDIGETIFEKEECVFAPAVIQNLVKIQNNASEPFVLTDSMGVCDREDVIPKLEILERENITFFKENDNIRIFKGINNLMPLIDKNKLALKPVVLISSRKDLLEEAAGKDIQTVWFNNNESAGSGFNKISSSWKEITGWLIFDMKNSCRERNTGETKVKVNLSLDGSGNSEISTGLGFFDHMLDQIARHSGSNLRIEAKGDLEVDEHHTVEDTAIVLGEAFNEALGDKTGFERYGFALPMDDSATMVLVDFGGRPDLVWKVKFYREKIGDMPTELFYHFFKSFAIGARCNLYIKAKGKNEHHKIEATFKAFARAIKMAIRREAESDFLPSTKGIL